MRRTRRMWRVLEGSSMHATGRSEGGGGGGGGVQI